MLYQQTSEEDLNETEIDNLSNKKFKEMVIKMFTLITFIHHSLGSLTMAIREEKESKLEENK